VAGAERSSTGACLHLRRAQLQRARADAPARAALRADDEAREAKAAAAAAKAAAKAERAAARQAALDAHAAKLAERAAAKAAKEAKLAAAAEAAAAAGPAKSRNQFVFKERAMQTTNRASRDKAVATEPAPKMTFAGACSRWLIYDWYLEDQRTQEKQRALKEALLRKARDAEARGAAGAAGAVAPRTSQPRMSELAEPAAAGALAPHAPGDSTDAVVDAIMAGPAMARATATLERRVSQNSFQDIVEDFKYWEDASDAFRERGDGSLLPLWTFAPERGRRRHVTALAWHPAYADLFAVGYGSYDFLRQAGGAVACYSLKNPAHPEYGFDTAAGVTALAFHPIHGALLVLGLYDGGVAVHDVRERRGGANVPIFASNARSGSAHVDPVWQVAWADDGAGAGGEAARGPLTFYSVAADGRVAVWTMTKSELTVATLIELTPSPADTPLLPPLPRLDSGEGGAGGEGGAAAAPAGAEAASGAPTSAADAAAASDASVLGTLVGGCCFEFNAAADGMFVVGTEEGGIHKCSTAFSSRYLATYAGHSMAVYALRWNPHHSGVFLSASADWTVKVWESHAREAVMTFDLGAAVGDAAWGGHSSTCFAAVTADGRCHVFDLSANKYEAVCAQKVVKKARLTKVAFNPVHPVLLCGDDKGGVTCLKLSPNLRKTTPPRGEEETVASVEMAKLNKLIELAKRGEGQAAKEAVSSRGATPASAAVAAAAGIDVL
jgi:dynein intermediate chain 1